MLFSMLGNTVFGGGNARDFFFCLPEIPPQACWRLDILLFAMLGKTDFGGGNARDFFFWAPMAFGDSWPFVTGPPGSAWH